MQLEREPLFEKARRTFDTPEFRGIEFIESEAKTVINRVPGNFLPFNWTINPYRGCSHACSYCIKSDIPILMSDGRPKPIGDVEVGDEIYGTVQGPTYRHYVKTRVLANWTTRKLAYRVVLEDGTELIASGDHRFLSDRGWKHVKGSEQGRGRRPHLTLNNKLIGTGAFGVPPPQDEDYRRGYLCGMIRGDAHLSSRAFVRPSGTRSLMHQFRLALVDLEALRRTRQYLAGVGVLTREFHFQDAVGYCKPLEAIRATSERDVSAIRDICLWPNRSTPSWSRGFLAGIFDAEGSFSGSLRISNTDPAIIDRIMWSLRDLGFVPTLENPHRANGLAQVRLLGGLPAAIRFFTAVDPAITRKRDIEGRALKSNARLDVLAVEPLGKRVRMYDITTGTRDFIANGVVSHNCFARPTHTYMDMNAGRDFETKIVVKVNAPQVLRRQLGGRSWKGEHIAMGTPTDAKSTIARHVWRRHTRPSASTVRRRGAGLPDASPARQTAATSCWCEPRRSAPARRGGRHGPSAARRARPRCQPLPNRIFLSAPFTRGLAEDSPVPPQGPAPGNTHVPGDGGVLQPSRWLKNRSTLLPFPVPEPADQLGLPHPHELPAGMARAGSGWDRRSPRQDRLGWGAWEIGIRVLTRDRPPDCPRGRPRDPARAGRRGRGADTDARPNRMLGDGQ